MQQVASLHKVDNPFFQNKQPRFRLKTLLWIILVTCVILLLAFLTMLIILHQQKFSVKFFTFTGNKRVSSEEISKEINAYLHGKSAKWLIPYNSVYLFPSEGIMHDLKDVFGFSSVSIDKVYKERVVHIMVSEEVARKIITFNDGSYFVSATGKLLEKIPDNSDMSGFFVLAIQEPPQNNKAIEAIRPDILNTMNFLEGKGIEGETFKRIEMQTIDSTDIKIVSSSDWYVFIDTKRKIDEQWQTAEEIYKQKILGTPEQKTLTYIDVRIPERAYYK